MLRLRNRRQKGARVTIYRVKDWNDHYENNRTRDLKRMDWVPIPNRMDKASYVRLVSHPDGAAHLGAWLAIVEIASRCDTRGTLIQDGIPLSPHDIAAISHLPAVVIEAAMHRLCSEVGWLEIDPQSIENKDVAPIPHEGAGFPHHDAPSRACDERNGTERNGTENQHVHGKRALVVVDPRDAWFDDFWAVYGKIRNANKAKAKVSFKRVVSNQTAFDRIMDRLRLQAPGYLAREPDKRPHATTWLNGARWEDEPDAPAGSVNGSVFATPSPDYAKDKYGYDEEDYRRFAKHGMRMGRMLEEPNGASA